jgi:hypothetical protein
VVKSLITWSILINIEGIFSDKDLQSQRFRNRAHAILKKELQRKGEADGDGDGHYKKERRTQTLFV